MAKPPTVDYCYLMSRTRAVLAFPPQGLPLWGHLLHPLLPRNQEVVGIGKETIFTVRPRSTFVSFAPLRISLDPP